MPFAVIITAFHDYRTAKRASIHQVADGLAEAGCEVAFVSTRFSWLSKRVGDSRLFLWDKANRVETVNGIQCLLWRTSIHPFRSDHWLADQLNARFYPIFAELPNTIFDRLVGAADYIIVESGVATIYLRRLKRLNPKAKIIYYGADRLETVGAHPFICTRLRQDHDLVDHFSLRSAQMKADFPKAPGRYFIAGFGVNPREYANIGPSPYPANQNVAVSVGSMLFDSSFFQTAGASFPDLQFEVIGSGVAFAAPPNVRLRPEMPFEKTLAYIKHASIGVAPYRAAEGAEYLAETSLKLAQYEYLGIPALCPTFAVGSSPNRIGYEPADPASITRAVATALTRVGEVSARAFPSWAEIAMQIIEPVRYGAEPIE